MHWDEYNVKDEFSILKQVFGVAPEPQELTEEIALECECDGCTQEDGEVARQYAYPTADELRAIDSVLLPALTANEPTLGLFQIPPRPIKIYQ
jgi:hypothetical protein